MLPTMAFFIDSILLSANFITEHALFFGAIIFAILIACKLNAHFAKPVSTEDTSDSESDRCDVSPIPEKEEENSDLDRSNNRTSLGLVRCRRLEKDRRTVDWVRDARKICRKLMFQKSYYLSLSSDSSEHLLFSRRTPIRRRHSNVGPFQLARAAKDFIVHGSSAKFQRQLSEMTKRKLPKPPSQFFEPSEVPIIPQNEKPEVYYILHNIKMLELPSEWYAQWKGLIVEEYKENDYLIRPGDKDNHIVVVLEGVIAVFITHTEGKELMVRKITVGDSFFSLLSILDVLMNHEIIFRNISVRALTECRIARCSTNSFRDSFIKNPEFWVRPIQIVLTRLLHVTLTTLHQYLGLSIELVKKRPDEKRNMDERHRHLSGITSSNRLQGKIRSRTHRLNSIDDSKEYLATAQRWFAEVLHLGVSPEAIALLAGRVTIENVPEKHLIVEQNSEDELLIMVLSGFLSISQEPIDGEDENIDEEQFFIYPRELIGGLQLLTGEPWFVTVRSHTCAIYATISKKDFFELVDIHPEIVLPVAHSVIRRLSSFVRHVDFAVDWVLLDSGQAVYRSGDVADSIFVLLSGRLRSVENKKVIEEFGRGDVLGMIEVLQRVPRATTVLAIRFSQLARLPEGLLNFIKIKFPQVGFRLVHLLGQYYTSSIQSTSTFRCGYKDGLSMTTGDPQSHIKNLHTIAVVAATPDVPLTAFTCELYHALTANLRVLRLSSQKIAELLDVSVLEKQADFRLMHWLNLQEDTYPLIIYECDTSATSWTRRCLRQADAILFVANGEQKPFQQSLMDDYLNMNEDGIRTNKELILLWDEKTVEPQGTIEWLKGSWFSGHHHIRIHKRMVQWDLKKVSESDIVSFYEQNIYGGKVDSGSDFSRLARILTGNAIGVVLGGGGARGASHVGVLRAIQEHGIPIDMIGGTSIGSMIGGLYAQEVEDLEQRAKSWFMMMASIWPKIWDLTYAHSAMFTGAGFNHGLQDLFSDSLIEDLWIPYFCISTDISNSEMRIHRTGPLWAYCRASMSLAGYLPPLCDPIDGHLLLDGGYVNNLPADVMQSMGAKIVIAVDVGSAAETNLYNYGDSLSGFWVLLKKLNPFAEPIKVLNMEEIQSRLAYVSCMQQLQSVKNAGYCQYVRPPIEEFKTLDFYRYDEIRDLGYKHGVKQFGELVKTNEDLKNVIDAEKLRSLKRRYWRREPSKLAMYDRGRASSFTNLAAQVSRVPKVREKNSLNDDEVAEDELSDVWWDEEEEEQEPDVHSQPAYNSEDVESIEAGYISEPCTTYQSKYTFSSEDEVSTDKNDTDNNRKRKTTLSEVNQNGEEKIEMQKVPSEKGPTVRFGLSKSLSDDKLQESQDMVLNSDRSETKIDNNAMQ
ncbi:Cyclic nucleotide-binding domain family protein [Brugia pahangi]